MSLSNMAKKVKVLDRLEALEVCNHLYRDKTHIITSFSCVFSFRYLPTLHWD